MKPTKRKTGSIYESLIKSERSAGIDEPPSKRFKRESRASIADLQNSTSTSLPATDVHKKKPSPSRGDDIPFPRGGASILTPLEHKQIQIEATRDALFEQQNALEENIGKHNSENLAIRPSVLKKDKSKSKSSKGKDGTRKSQVEDEVIKIEGLNYKRLVPGSLVLGQVSQINNHDIALALPNNLVGYVPLTSISEILTANVERILSFEAHNDVNRQKDDEDIEAKDLFFIGQYLRAMVVSTGDEAISKSHEKGKRRIELSLRPRDANSGITKNEIVPFSMVMASVVSVEDHGLIMDLGLLNAGVRGFMSSKETDYGIKHSTLKEGAVLLCMVTGLSPNGNTVKLSADIAKIANIKRSNYLVEGPTVNVFLPGTAVELLITEVTLSGIAGKIMGMIDVTADLTHSGLFKNGTDIATKYKIGRKIKGRIVCTFPNKQPPKLGISLLDHVLSFSSQQTQQYGLLRHPLEVIPLSATVEEVTVKKVESRVGLFVDIGMKNVSGFVHISRIADKKVDSLLELSGPYKIGSIHRGRVIGYNSIDGLYLLSLEVSVLNQAFLRVEDLKVGEIVHGVVEKLVVNSSGMVGVLVTLADGITGLVPEMHMADISLLHPEKKFKAGMKVTARVLSTDPGKRKIRLTLKKTLVNSEALPLTNYANIALGMQSPGTITNILPSGAVVQFYGAVRGFLPISEMSESYIQDPSQHFRIGQVVNVHVLTIDANSGKLTVSCKDSTSFSIAQQNVFKALSITDLVSATVIEKSAKDIRVELLPSSIRGIIPAAQLIDGSELKNLSALKRIRVGQKLHNLVILDKAEQNRFVTLTSKPSVVQAVKEQTFLRDFDDVKEGNVVQGFIRNVTASAVFIQFGHDLIGLLPRTQLPNEALVLPDFGFTRFQFVKVTILAVDQNQRRFWLSMKKVGISHHGELGDAVSPHHNTTASISNPVDKTIKSMHDLTLGKVTQARIASIKDTQINVQLADNIQGRIDISQIFDTWEDIKDRKHPLRSFTPKQVISVRILGIHDARNHRFLPISHRAGKTPLFELSAKSSDQNCGSFEVLTFDKVEVGTSWIAFVNNISNDCLWVNLSPNVRGRIQALDISDDVSLIKDLYTNFPVGSAIRVRVIGIDIKNHQLDLSARTTQIAKKLTFQHLSKDMVVPGKVTRVNERQVMIQISDIVSGPVNLPDLADDFSRANPSAYSKNEIIRVCITEIDTANQRIRLSTRPSRILSSALPVIDREIISVSQLSVNDIVRGFVKRVGDNGVFINLGGSVTAFVRVSDLSDSYLKEWKSTFQVDQLVKGKIIFVDSNKNHVQLSLKASILDENYTPPITFADLRVGQIISGKIRKVEDFGVFIVINRSTNVSGLCHKSEMAEGRIDNVRNLYEEGDEVKAKILKLEADRKRISFGLKASYFDYDSKDEESVGDGIPAELAEIAVGNIVNRKEETGQENDTLSSAVASPPATNEEDNAHSSNRIMQHVNEQAKVTVLDPGGFDWTASVFDNNFQGFEKDDFEKGVDAWQKKIQRKATIKIDRTGELDANGPQSSSDFERLLIGQPSSSFLWIQYMAFQVKLGEFARAREVAERALQMIDIREDTEKMNVWIALLNLENTYGSDDTLEDVFKRACLYSDPQEIYERLTSIYIQSEKYNKADEVFQALVKKFSQSPAVWYNYAHFLHQTLSSPDRARLLLPRAIQSLPSHTHVNLTVRFAALEFDSPGGSPERGRTMFEGVLSTFPKRLDLWNQLLDLEIHQGNRTTIRSLFDRVIKTKGLKPRGAKAWFKRWSDWEAENGDVSSQHKVRAKAQEWVRNMG